ncbi:YraN family protein [Cyanobacterium aponinum FACHB-4101]|uniref:YraN family protein n=1 Tax=Cyanobacterium aponinum TaxID=379064 RepID=UPI0016806848|nr:YraN family protein [Cyanobacterium aponinum]MBD2394133.1 YraN family protein [Cyanobacterium aponinum FACHB-4101]
MKKIGSLGEKIIAQWLINKGYSVIESNWHCRWGEIDLIVINKSLKEIIFVEVKTRSIKNWDDNGLYSINNKKQEKLWLTASLFLEKNQIFTDWNCRFDIALLTYKKLTNFGTVFSVSDNCLRPKFNYEGYQFEIVDYLENAF